MSKHTQSILLFGLILPATILCLFLGGVLHGRGKLEAKKKVKQTEFENYVEASKLVADIQHMLAAENRREQMAFWDEQLGKEFIQSLTMNLNDIMSGYTENQLLRTELSRPSSRSPLAGATENEYSRFKLSFVGGFDPLQKTLAELEIRMPQLVLEDLKMTPAPAVPGEPPKLKFEIVYLCWQEGADDSQS